MANMRNKWEFYGSILEALGVDYTDAELKNNETLRAKLLEGLGVEHTYDDVNQYPLWREKLVEGVGNMSGGGGETWNTVFEGNVTTEENEFGMITGIIEDVPELTADELRITFNGVEYICPKDAEHGGYGAPFNEGSFDWSEYPFNINGSNLVTQTAGTYSLKIEEPQSGGESDFSTAEVEFKNQTTKALTISCCCIIDNNIQVPTFPLKAAKNKTYTVVLYKGSQKVSIPLGAELVTVTGDITVGNEERIIIINGSGSVLLQP